jgi:hypothetical protein
MKRKDKVINLVVTQRQLERAIKGGLKDAMFAHGDITTDYIESAIKRIFGQMKKYKLRQNNLTKDLIK